VPRNWAFYSHSLSCQKRPPLFQPHSIPFSSEVHTLVWRQPISFLSIIKPLAKLEVVFELDDFSEPVYYEFRVSGRLSQQGTGWFEGMSLSVDEDTTPPQTIIHGYVLDRAALHGLINRIRDLGLTLVSVQRIGGEPGTEQGDLEGDANVQEV
jgi:hypothetical protein